MLGQLICFKGFTELMQNMFTWCCQIGGVYTGRICDNMTKPSSFHTNKTMKRLARRFVTSEINMC